MKKSIGNVLIVTCYLSMVAALIMTTACSVSEPSTTQPVQITGFSGNVTQELSLGDLGITATAQELNYVDGVTSAIQTQFTGKAPTNLAGLSGLLADDQHILDAEAISAIENAGALTMPAFTLGGTITTTGKNLDQANENLRLICAGANRGISLTNNYDGNLGITFRSTFNSASPANNDFLYQRRIFANNSISASTEYFRIEYISTNVSDGSESGKIIWHIADTSNGQLNQVMTLDGAGVLSIDDSYDTFDDYDDAIRLKRAFSEGEKSVLVEIGVMEYKVVDYGEGRKEGKYMINTQQLYALLAGGIYQNRDKIDLLEARIKVLEGKLK